MGYLTGLIMDLMQRNTLELTTSMAEVTDGQVVREVSQ